MFAQSGKFAVQTVKLQLILISLRQLRQAGCGVAVKTLRYHEMNPIMKASAVATDIEVESGINRIR